MSESYFEAAFSRLEKAHDDGTLQWFELHLHPEDFNRLSAEDASSGHFVVKSDGIYFCGIKVLVDLGAERLDVGDSA